MRRKKLRCLLVSIALGAVCVPAALAAPVALAPGDPAPALTGVTHGTERKRWAADWTEHKLTVVNFWGTWCQPCREEMPELQALQDRLGESGLQVIGAFESWEPREEVDKFLEDVSVRYLNISADKQVDRRWGGLGVKPTTFLVSGEGKILRRYVGAMPEQTAGLIADVEAVIEGRPMPAQYIPEDAAPDFGTSAPKR